MRFALPSEQLSLLSIRPEYRIEGNTHARNAYGAAAQEIVCAALSLRAIPINGSCEICFDACDDTAKPVLRNKIVPQGRKNGRV